jgi:PST family polysaccharide transporter
VVAFYAGADRLINVCIALMQTPVTALYPRASSFAHVNPDETARVTRLAVALLLPLGAIGSILLFFLAPLIVEIALGPGYEEAVPVLRILGVLLPLMGVLLPLSGQWVIPLGMDSLLTRITLSAGVLHVVLALLLASQFEHIGIAWAWVCTETYMLLVISIVLLRRNLNPFRIAPLVLREDTPAGVSPS